MKRTLYNRVRNFDKPNEANEITLYWYSGLLWHRYFSQRQRRASCCRQEAGLLSPPTLSFEKEAAPCWNACPSRLPLRLPSRVSLKWLVTWFLNSLPTKETSLDDIGLRMAFISALRNSIPRTYVIFMVQCLGSSIYPAVDWTHHEMTTAQMSFLDLESLTDENKQSLDLLLIFE